ncbi:VanZ family protein [Leucobacter sp. G161]|uniref:VanZ family protein n=1 Tax=Leucobacter sp. G161 TaxID=663704 RepID=UPI00073CA8C6|nr:VanZ family protein [Leucobacter sp. G161]KUF08077.1 hypothetical protein AUL38_06225 [Leucobacter sp. G161]
MTSHQSDRRSARRGLSARQWVGAVGLGAVLLAALAITLNPTPVERGRSDTVWAFLDMLHRIGIPESFGYLELEFTANIIMFLPLGFFFALLVAERSWWLALAFPLVLSIGIELTQLLVLPERFADISDVIANSLGGWLGAGVAAFVPRGKSADELR